MKIEKIIKEIDKHSWWVEESPATHQVAEWAWQGFNGTADILDRKNLSIGFYCYRNNYFSEVTSRDEKIAQFEYIFFQQKKNEKYLQKLTLGWRNDFKNVADFGWSFLKNIEKMDRNEIAKNYKKMTTDYCKGAILMLVTECIDPYTEDVVPELLRKELPKIKGNEIGHIAAAMSSPARISFMEEERMLFLQGAMNANNKKVFDKYVAKLEKNFHWIKTHYGEAIHKSSSEYAKEMLAHRKKHAPKQIKKELDSLKNKIKNIKQEKKKIIRKYKLSNNLVAKFEIVSLFGGMIDYRKRYAMQMTYVIYKLLKKFEEILEVDSKNLAYATYEELYQWLANGGKIDLKTLKDRESFSVFVSSNVKGKKSYEFITGKDAKLIHNKIFKIEKSGEISGTVASAPVKKVQGKVSVVLNTSKDKFQEGDILVTSMTRPDFLPLMRKAKAIITDEGGLTCHAAIVSRELKIPCIIGTKIATRQLKTGDTVEMDVKTGIVKIL